MIRHWNELSGMTGRGSPCSGLVGKVVIGHWLDPMFFSNLID